MKPKRMRCLTVCSVVLLVGCSSHRRGSDDSALVARANGQGMEIRIVVRARSSEWKVTDVLYFDVVVTNRTADRIRVPYIYDSAIEIDDKQYTQFPKPKLSGETERIVAGGSEAAHGTLTLNGKAFRTVDAKTGRLPLKLAAGEHTLVLVCGPYKSDPVTFRLAE